ncbi:MULTISPECIES: hypothetical protein [unclassified Pseudoclavibacter]|uniref:hypothetical protein n=1 Tax=unclassified Pseudoclavibacter TaxID=2615177 RepID=UPI001BA93601|nr:hypothetical protein [Pseudoclavibacter sp. Marseille-Q4354]MBS3177830.1 hypothetical protein [Pseudoclavibacter sp. Marseille-Q4354]
MPNRAHRAEEESLVEFLADYTPDEVTFSLSTGETPLLRAMLNPDIEARLGIAERLLDDGADASVTLSSGLNALHLLFSNREHDLDREAALAARLIAGGADVNAISKRQGPPLLTMIDSGMASLTGIGVVIDAITESTMIDLEVLVNRRGRPRKTLREEIATSAWHIPEVRERLGISYQP